MLVELFTQDGPRGGVNIHILGLVVFAFYYKYICRRGPNQIKMYVRIFVHIHRRSDGVPELWALSGLGAMPHGLRQGSNNGNEL